MWGAERRWDCRILQRVFIFFQIAILTMVSYNDIGGLLFMLEKIEVMWLCMYCANDEM